MTNNSEQFDAVFMRLQGLAPLKTWSLIVTLMGDLQPQAQGVLSSQMMQQICAPFGVKPEAFRVALHRLKKDGWLVAERRGRGSVYRLSEMGVQATAAAYEQVYRGPCDAPENWRLAMVKEPQEGGLQIGPNLMVLRDKFPISAESLALETPFSQVPDWMKDALVSASEVAELAAFGAALNIADFPKSPEQRYSLRLLILHHWRRIILRHDGDVEKMLGADWAGYAVRQRVHALFDALERLENKVFEAV